MAQSDRWLGLFFLIAACVIMFVWVPLDTETGLVEKVRRRLIIGDGLAPTVAGAVLFVGGVMTLAKPGANVALTRATVGWLLGLLALFALSLALMRWAGPAVAAVLLEDGYRPLRASVPWKYIGYLLGGTCMVGGLTTYARGAFRPMDWIVAGLATMAIALLYDLPFDDLLLPPNGDV